jgi:hypothetical protein
MLSPIRIPVPAAFGRFNGGVILYRSNEATLALLREWQVWFHEENLRWDQRTLREVLWASDIRLATLPPEYNIRRFKYVLFWSRDEARPKILHLHYFKRGLWTYVEQWWGTVMRRTRRRLGRLRAGMSHGR